MPTPDPPVVVVREPGRTPLHLVLHEPLEVGRDCAGVLLDDPGISRCHLALRPEGDRVVVVDLGSTNGTTVDGRTVEAPVVLTPGMVVRLGDTTIRLGTLVRGARSTGTAGAGGAAGATGAAGAERPVTSIERVAAEVAADRLAPPQAAVRDGTVTIVFTDIESSTEQAASFGDQRWFEVLTVHNGVLRDRLAEHAGVEVKSQGDGFMLTFASARRAVAWMIDVQRDMAALRAARPEHAVRIRVGGHTGEAIVGDDGDLFGLHVNIAARVAGAAAGDEILVSSLVREIVEPRGDLRFGPSRRAQLKGLAGTFVLHPVLWDAPAAGG